MNEEQDATVLQKRSVDFSLYVHETKKKVVEIDIFPGKSCFETVRTNESAHIQHEHDCSVVTLYLTNEEKLLGAEANFFLIRSKFALTLEKIQLSECVMMKFTPKLSFFN